VEDNECGDAGLGGEMRNAVYSNTVYVERDLDTPNDEQYYTLADEDDQQLLKGYNMVYRTVSFIAANDAHIGLFKGPDMQGV
jgi:hypothetical protein